VDALFDFNSQANLIAEDLVNKLGLEFHDHSNPYPFGWVNKDVELKVTKQCKIKFSINANYIDEVEVNVVLLYVYGVVFGSPYMGMRDTIFMGEKTSYPLSRMGSLSSSMHTKVNPRSLW
jgi:hypothetical protein